MDMIFTHVFFVIYFVTSVDMNLHYFERIFSSGEQKDRQELVSTS